MPSSNRARFAVPDVVAAGTTVGLDVKSVEMRTPDEFATAVAAVNVERTDTHAGARGVVRDQRQASHLTGDQSIDDAMGGAHAHEAPGRRYGSDRLQILMDDTGLCVW